VPRPSAMRRATRRAEFVPMAPPQQSKPSPSVESLIEKFSNCKYR
jgi:hypothetical protein